MIRKEEIIKHAHIPVRLRKIRVVNDYKMELHNIKPLKF